MDSHRTESSPAAEIVIREDEVPPKAAKVVTRGGVSVGIYRRDGQYYAFLNRCPHEQGPVCEGGISGAVVAGAESNWRPEWVKEGDVLLCPWHGMEFDLKTGACFSRKELRLLKVKVEAENGTIRIRL